MQILCKAGAQYNTVKFETAPTNVNICGKNKLFLLIAPMIYNVNYHFGHCEAY